MSRTYVSVLIASLVLAGFATTALAAGDVARGERVFKRCKSCHSIEPGKNRIGPSLAGVIGRQAGTAEGYSYSQAMIAYGAAGTVWEEETLDVYLTDPRVVVPGTKKAFSGLKSTEDRADVIAFLKQHSS